MAPSAIVWNFFEKQWTKNHPQCLSGLSRALFPTTFLEIAVFKESQSLEFRSWLRPRAVSRLRARFARDEIVKSLRSELIRYKLFTSDWLWNEVCQSAVFSKIDITMTTINKSFKNDKIWIKIGNACCGVFFVDWATLGRGKFDLGANAPCPGAFFHSVWRKKVFWTQWLEEMFISSNMRGDISLLNVYCGAAMIEVCLWSKKSAIRWVFKPQTAFE